jgi:N utilization substance protein B
MANRHDAREWAVQFLFQREFNPGRDIGKALDDYWHELFLVGTETEHEKATALDRPIDWEADKAAYWKKQDPKGRLRQFARKLVFGTIEHMQEIDERLHAYAEHWDIERMGIVDRTILRTAMYEMLYCDDVPPVVAINEAVETAKDLSCNESGRFVNGILDRALKDIDRNPRTGGVKR